VLLVGDINSPLARQLAAGAGDARIIGVGYGFEGACHAIAQLGPEIDALVVATTPMALGAVTALARLHRQIPVVVCEEVPLAGQITPTLSTCAVRPEIIGEEMVRIIESMLAGAPIERRLLAPEMTRRDSF
jgi:DNA-binding LacI/PurR family transcriptional regulator